MIMGSFPPDGFTTTLENALPYAFNSVYVPGTWGNDNGGEGMVRVYVVPDGNKRRFPNEKAAYNHSTLKTFTATRRKNGVSAYGAAGNVAEDAGWSVFNSGMPPPWASGAGPKDGGG